MIIARYAGRDSVLTKRMSIPDFMKRIVADGSVGSVIRTLRTYLDGNWKIRRHTTKFLTMIQQLISSYDASEIRIYDKAMLYGTYRDTPPLARHIVFDPMRAKVKRALISNYKLSFPLALLDIYSSMNGANLFWSVRYIGKDQIRVPFHYLSIYGIPTTNDRKYLEPYNISVEDLNRPKGTPNCRRKAWIMQKNNPDQQGGHYHGNLCKSTYPLYPL